MPETITTLNPANEEIIKLYDTMSDAQLLDRLDAAHHRFQTWRHTSLQERQDHLLAIADGLDRKQDEYAHLITNEMGKPLSQSKAEISKCAAVCRYYANHSGDVLAESTKALDDSTIASTYTRPLGVILSIMPWNFPFWQVMRFVAPNLMTGNVCMLKHAPNVTGCALALESLMKEVGLPQDCFSVILADHKQVGQVLMDYRVRGVTLTGSDRAGKAIASQAGEALKKSVLELGGSDPYIVLDDADLNLAVETCVASRLINSGQTCISAKRFIVTKSVAGEFTERVIQAMSRKSYGNPLDDVDLGPLAREDLRDKVHSQVLQSIDQGAKLALNGQIPEGTGFYYPPTVLTSVSSGMPAFDDEIFGPVASVIEAQDEAQAVAIANQSRYGLGAAIFSKDIERAEYLAAHEIEAGSCAINDFVRSHPAATFGGIKDSGYGRELGSQGLLEFANIKTVTKQS
ncbi:NAD-dependent succinate-semialdehyde dehydrogenase [Pseudobacteriovorax antillogorgiicola]|uniref:Succinate-semialdehyde dehydrogenase / glutarate-semialdehyde dehydrogenase n=1 Tax=Pseudobacteriovorax antillogorgiicola TaxID=1513793 RepID=A0A1Y6BH85_9BACT|nr:NAD-dependent succinate-semialdehyde dehydrogenase [Pseudobacteriovorax antillogorgiicola]TCS56183.1 succinate-semialdehyde dehydrogenase/glutarate-semialdehyde dehydrogenase [Pseudobacteriovorax antillogorgiicola]SMF08921.1 succinate-semialdehyde dehydrogenase / glutarate-semialdehyde dehydrogenase [Pseudobacteriovorax antillogorgiicola]